MRGDCSIQVGGRPFSDEEIAACAQREGLLSLEVELAATDKCACPACLAAGQQAQAPLSPQEIGQVMTQAKDLGARRCILVDSEPGPYPRLEQLVGQVAALGMDVELFTDGAGMSPSLARTLCQSGVSVSIRLDSLDGPLHDRLAMSALQTLQDAGYGRDGKPRLAVRIAVGQENLEELPALWRWARRRGIEPAVQIITPRQGPDQAARVIEPERAKRLFEELGRLDRDEFARIWALPPSLAGRSCKRHLYACHLTACGTIFACVGVTIPLGNVRADPLRAILEASEVMEDLRAFQIKVKEPCRSCCQTTDCYGCRGAAYQLTGDYLAGDQMCWKAAGIEIPRLPVGVADLIPHGPLVRTIDRLVEVGEHVSRSHYLVAPGSPLVDEAGRLDELAYIEMIAQAFAACYGFHLSSEERALHWGLLLGIKDLVISGESRVGDRLQIEVNKVTRFGDFGVVQGTIRHEDGRLVARGQLKVWRPGAESLKAIMQ